MDKPSKRTEAIINDHHDHLLSRRKSREIVSAFVTCDIAAAMDPQHDGQVFGIWCGGSVDIEIQAILGPEVFAFRSTRGHALRLGAHHRLSFRRDVVIGSGERDRSSPSPIAFGGFGKWNVPEDQRPFRPRLRGHRAA